MSDAMALGLLIAIPAIGTALLAALPLWLVMAATRPGWFRFAAVVDAWVLGTATIHIDVVTTLFGVGYDGTRIRDWKILHKAPCTLREWRRRILFHTPKEICVPIACGNFGLRRL